MQTKAEVTKLFLSDLAALLRKWDAMITAEDHYGGYPECGEDIRMEVDIKSVVGPDGQVFRDFTVVDLGRCFDAGIVSLQATDTVSVPHVKREQEPDGAPCDWCGQNMVTVDGCTGNKKIEFSDGSQLDSSPYDGSGGLRCPDCNVFTGHRHHPGCDMEKCPKCGGQLVSCRCLVTIIAGSPR